jgi:hypothetical protein
MHESSNLFDLWHVERLSSLRPIQLSHERTQLINHALKLANARGLLLLFNKIFDSQFDIKD